MSTPHPQGLGAQLAMERALSSARLASDDIDYVNLHGTATRTNDASEDAAVCAVLGTRTPCNSTKGATGHLLGAAGITESLVSVIALEEQWMPGSLQTRTIDPELRSAYVLAGRAAPLRRVLSNSFGFGGSNCSVVFGLAG
jgi:3-oxoacyl-[acyl-carrier-protein] synthase-1